MAHKDIQIKFTVGGRNFEAVGFLAGGETSVTRDEIFKRTAAKNNGAIRGEDETFIHERRGELPAELQPYWLVTETIGPHYYLCRSCFYFDGLRWRQQWRKDDWWDRDYLVVRRCP